jgi:outer membrane biosynthesis protein TonB
VAVKPDATAPPPEPEPEPASKTKQKQKVREPSPEPEPEAVVGSYGQAKKPERRRFPTAVRLRTGKVLLAGGRTGASTGSATDTCELWDPQFKIWTELPPMAAPRERTTPASMQDAAVCQYLLY